MTTLFHFAHVVKPHNFAKGLGRSLAEVREENIHSLELLGLTAADHDRIENARRDAYAEAIKIMPEAEAAEVAGDAAVAEFDHLMAMRAAIREANREKPAKRKPYTAQDVQWWAEQTLKADYESVCDSIEFNAGAALATARMSAGFPIL